MTKQIESGAPTHSALSSRQRKVLRGTAHGLKPVVQVGQKGVTETALAEVDKALDAHELIKVRLAGARDERLAAIGRIEADVTACLVGQVGRVAIFYRANPDPEKRRVDPGRA